ncbi:hypothetical protein, partial [Nocardia abscessus]|uniref:hypothetical protein n=1 Tax=Nocardia abscessus TaxID=120957 RepID=UPI002455C507
MSVGRGGGGGGRGRVASRKNDTRVVVGGARGGEGLDPQPADRDPGYPHLPDRLRCGVHRLP